MAVIIKSPTEIARMREAGKILGEVYLRMEEKLSLASRFGVTIFYSKPNAGEYLNIVRELTRRNGIDIGEKELSDIARKWELRHGGMSGRTASQLITWLRGEAARLKEK